MNQLLAGFILVLIVFVSSLPVAAGGPEEEESGAAASRTVSAVDASSKSPLELLPLEIHFKILETLPPKEVNNLACASKVMSKSVSKFRTYCRETYQHDIKTIIRVHESNPAGYELPLFASRIEMEARIPSQKLQQVPSAYKEEVWKDCILGLDIFAATTNSSIYAIADRMADYQKVNMADVMLAAMYLEEAPSYLEKAAIHHLFSSYTVFHKEEGLADWQQQVLPGKKEGLQQFIEKMYVEFVPGQDLAVRPDQKLVVKRGQLGEAANIEVLDDIFQLDQPQPEMVLDFEGRNLTARLDNQNLPAQLTNLAIINSGGAITQIGDEFLYGNRSLKTLTLSLPQVMQVGNNFLSNNLSLKTLMLSLPQLTQVGGAFLSNNPSLNTLTLSLPQVARVGEGCLAHCYSLKTLTLSFPQVERIEDSFLWGCHSLKTLTLSLPQPQPQPQLAQVGGCFLYQNQSLKTLTLILPQLTQIGGSFLYQNQSLKTLTLSLPQLTQIGGGFLAGCEHLRTVDLRSLLKLEKVEVDRFMDKMTTLEEVLIDARQEEFFEELLKDKPDLMSKFKIVA